MHELPPARVANMQARRGRIFAAAQAELAAGGYSALTVRSVAQAAGVTVPTIYNLIGAKEALVGALIGQALDCLDREMAGLPPARGVARAEAAIEMNFAQLRAEPARYRAVFRALYEFNSDAQGNFLGAMFRRAGQIYEHAVAEAREDGVLRGQMLALPLAHHVLHGVMESLKLWASESLSVEMARARALYTLYVTLLADATEPARAQLHAALRAHEEMLNR